MGIILCNLHKSILVALKLLNKNEDEEKYYSRIKSSFMSDLFLLKYMLQNENNCQKFCPILPMILWSIKNCINRPNMTIVCGKMN